MTPDPSQLDADLRVLFPGCGEGGLLRLAAPLSLWGGVDPRTAIIIASGHPDAGRSVTGAVLGIERPIGSSSSSSVLLELIRGGRAPAAILLGKADAILVVGCLVARQLGFVAPPVVEIGPARLSALADGRYRIDASAAGAIVRSA